MHTLLVMSLYSCVSPVVITHTYLSIYLTRSDCIMFNSRDINRDVIDTIDYPSSSSDVFIVIDSFGGTDQLS